MNTDIPPAPTGNRCGHEVKHPRFFKKPHNECPDFLKRAQKICESFYCSPHEYLPNLPFLNSSESKKRSERREAISSSLQLIFQHTDLTTLQAGTPSETGTIGIQLGYMSRILNVGKKRIYRALKDLELANYLKVEYKRYAKFGKYLTIRRITLFRKLFHHLGISNMRLDRAQHYKRKSLSKSNGHKINQTIYMTPSERRSSSKNIARLHHSIKFGRVVPS